MVVPYGGGSHQDVGDESWAKENVVTGILRLVRENGIFSTFGGLPAMLCKQVSDALVLCI